MKKLIFILILFLGFNNYALASTKTFERTKDNLRVPEGIEVTDQNINYILNTKAVDVTEKIYDFAYVISDEEEKKLYKKIKDFIDYTNIDLVILTEKDIYTDPAAYAFNFYDYNDFKKEGLIFFINKNQANYDIYMWTAGDVVDIYTEKRISDILEYVHDFFEDKKYSEGVNKFVDVVYGFYMASKEDILTIDSSGKVVKSIPWIDLIILSIAITFIIVFFLFFGKEKLNDKVFFQDEFLDNDSFEKIEESFVDKETIKVEKSNKKK